MENASVFGENLLIGINYILSIVVNFAHMTFPGTNVPYIMIPIGVWGIYFIWKFIMGQMFDVEWKK